MTTALGSTTAAPDFLSRLGTPSNPAGGAGNEMSERFLKLLVTQMQNQDPLNPLDNAQMTTQMAQINTVSGIEKLNQSVADLSRSLSEQLSGLGIGAGLQRLDGTLQTLQGQMLQSQALQGAALVGRQVLLPGSSLTLRDGVGVGAFDLSGPADHVAVEVLGPAGQVLDTVDLGAQSAGRAGFSWRPPAGVPTEGLSFRLNARSGAATVPAQTLMADTVNAVSTGSGGLVLELAHRGSTPFSQVKAVS